MTIIKAGHKYALENFEGTVPRQTIQFIEKEPVSDHPLSKPDLQTIHDGTTNEEVLLMLIDRLKFLGNKLSCRENSIAVTKCEEALMWLNKRTADRKARGVEGTNAP